MLLGHTCVQGLEQFKNTDELILQFRDGQWKWFHGATLCVDSFFVIGGILVAYIATKIVLRTFRGIRAIPGKLELWRIQDLKIAFYHG